jgi:O-succinylbenzoic acid--CoA ligase
VVVATRDERWGEASVVFATDLQDPDAVLETVRERVAAELGKPARPARVMVLPELPALASGKPDREALRRLLRRL